MFAFRLFWEDHGGHERKWQARGGRTLLFIPSTSAQVLSLSFPFFLTFGPTSAPFRSRPWHQLPWRWDPHRITDGGKVNVDRAWTEFVF